MTAATATPASAPVYTATDLTFDPVAHEYRLPDGRPVPSVTQILSAVGVSLDFEALAQMSARTAAAVDLKRDLGHALHADAHAFDDDDLEWATVDERVRPYLEAWVAFRANTQITPTARERRVFHPVFRYAGTLDGIFLTPNGRRVLVDIKTGDPDDSGCRWQTAAYQYAFAIEHPREHIDERWGVRLMPGRSVPYDIAIYRDWRDWLAFQAFVTTFHYQAARRGRSAART